MQVRPSGFDHLRMTRALLWLFFLADLAGIAWAVRVLVREARRHLAWHLGQRRARRLDPAQAGTAQAGPVQAGTVQAGPVQAGTVLPDRSAVRRILARDVPAQRAPEPADRTRPAPVLRPRP